MAQPTKDELISAWDWTDDALLDIADSRKKLGKTTPILDRCEGVLTTILSLLDTHINPPDLSEVRNEIIKSVFPDGELPNNDDAVTWYMDGVDKAIDHLAPRIAINAPVTETVDIATLKHMAVGHFASNREEVFGQSDTAIRCSIDYIAANYTLSRKGGT